jgi:hypothetical protein
METQYDTPNPKMCYEKYLDHGTRGQSHDARLPVVQSHLASHMKGQLVDMTGRRVLTFRNPTA